MVLGTALLLVGLAATSPEAPSPSPAGAAPAAGAPAKKARPALAVPALPTVEGEVLALDPRAHQLRVRTAAGELLLTYDRNTAFREEGAVVTPLAAAAGRRIRAGLQGTTGVAWVVLVATPPVAPERVPPAALPASDAPGSAPPPAAPASTPAATP